MRISILTLTYLLGVLSSLYAQSSLLDQFLYISNEDSIQVEDFLYEHGDYLIWFVGDDVESQKVIDNYLSLTQEIETEHGVHLVFVSRHTPTLNIAQVLESSQLSSGNSFQVSNFEAFYTGELELFFISNQKEETHRVSGLVTNNTLDQLITQHLVLPYDPILDGFFLECLTDNHSCDTLEYLTFSKGQVSMNGKVYTEIKKDQAIHLVRESTDENAIYYFKEESNEEIVLYTFDYHICDTVMLYSVLTQSFTEVIITDQYTKDGNIHWVTNLPFDCSGELYLEIIAGVGTNAGLLPLIDLESVRSTLLCQYQSGDITYSNGECDPDKPNDRSVSLYPNPATDQITLVSSFTDISIDGLFDMQGRRVQLNLLDDMTVSTQNLASGIYILKASVGGVDQYFQFVKQ